MTKQEAIETIRMAIAQVEWEYPMDYAAAFDMAVEALSQPEIIRCKDCRRNHRCAVQSKFAYADDEENWFCAYGKREEGR